MKLSVCAYIAVSSTISVQCSVHPAMLVEFSVPYSVSVVSFLLAFIHIMQNSIPRAHVHQRSGQRSATYKTGKR